MRKLVLTLSLLLFCGSIASAQSLPNDLGWMIPGTPTASGSYLFTATRTIKFQANFSGSFDRCVTAPSVADTYAIWDYPSGGTNTQIGTMVLGTNCDTTDGTTFTTTGGTVKTVNAGDAVILIPPATLHGETGVGGTFVGVLSSAIKATTESGGAATLTASCTFDGCTDTNRIDNSTNTGALAITTDTAAHMHDGATEYVEIDIGTSVPSSITLTGGSGVTLNYGVIGNTFNATTCGAPAANSAVIISAKWNASSGDLTVTGCGPVPATSSLAVALGGTGSTTGGLLTATSTNSNVMGVNFNFRGAVANSTIGAVTCPFTMSFPASLTTPTSQGTCGTAPTGSASDYIIAVNGTQKGDISLAASTCAATLTAASSFTCTAGQRLTVTAPATTHSEADVAIDLAYTR